MSGQNPAVSNYDRGSLYSTLGLLGLIVCNIAIELVEGRYISPATGIGLRRWYLDPVINIVVILLIVILQKPLIFRRSRWTFEMRDLAVGIGCGGALSFFIRLTSDDTVSPDYLFSALAIGIMPVLEELFFRGVVLRSLSARHSPWIAVTAVAGLATLYHRDFAVAFVQQTVLSLVYLKRDYSLLASISCHVAMSAVLLLPIPRL